MTLRAKPPSTLPRVITSGWSGSVWRLTSCWSATTTWAATAIASIAWWGRAAWPPRPITSMSSPSLAAVAGPGVALSGPPAGREDVQGEDGGDRGRLERAVLDHPRGAGAALLGGLEEQLDVSRAAAPAREQRRGAEQHGGVGVVAAQVGDAGHGGGVVGTSFASWIGSASMSARRATVGPSARPRSGR
jgi:hypothetical protein